MKTTPDPKPVNKQEEKIKTFRLIKCQCVDFKPKIQTILGFWA